MPSTPKTSHCSCDTAVQPFTPPTRPKFDTHNTADRLREAQRKLPMFKMKSNIRKDRRSIFRETGLLEDDNDIGDTSGRDHRYSEKEHQLGELKSLAVETRRTIDSSDQEDNQEDGEDVRRMSTNQDDEATSPRSASNRDRWYTKLVSGRRPRIKAAATAPPPTVSSLSRFTMIALLIAVVLPGFSYNNGREMVDLGGADAGVVRGNRASAGPILDIRANSPTDVCTRWSQQTALLNGTLWIYGGQSKTSGDQTNNTWNNNFLKLDLTKSWDAKSPALSGLPQPSGPPAVANGYLWNDYNNLFLYGGEFADNPYVTPDPIAVWKYTIASETWTKYADPKTFAGNNSAPGDQPVQRAAEGAGVSVPELGVSWYFGGHLDWATTPGWSTQTPRLYLKSLLEFTHPGYMNSGVKPLASGTGAGDGGAYRNITEGNIQTDQGFSERADGVLVFVPGWGESGVLIGLGGGIQESDSFSNDFSTLDVYDIANSIWYHQQAKGEAPTVRVNPCAVVAVAPDASSFQIYLYGGQNLQPFKEQTQYTDMYILTIPSFTWVRVPDQPNPPPARAGHTCNLRDGQMIVVGGYVGTNIPCDSPGIYVFNASSLQWGSSFKALSPKPDFNAENSVLAGSYGYKVPDEVVSVIGGSPDGGATATTPAAGPATGGPFATGRSPVFTVTVGPGGATETAWGPGVTQPGAAGSSPPSSSTSPGLIAAAVIAGIAGLLAGYLGFCAWLYRRQVRAYKNHLAVANRFPGAGASKTSGLAAFFKRGGSKEGRGMAAGGALSEKHHAYGALGRSHHMHNESSSTGDAESFAWVGREEPKAAWLSDEPTPASGTGTSSSGARKYSGSPFGEERGAFPWHAQGSGSGSNVIPGGRPQRRSSDSGGSSSSTEGLLDGQEPSFFSVVLGPRRALRVVNGLEEGE